MNPKTPEDTIAAIATPMGEGGIGIVRLSGPEALAIAGRLFVSSRGRDLSKNERQVYHGEIWDGDTSVDEALVHVMRAPHSYTREDVVEINCHGGPGPLKSVLELTLREGARLAGPGEFTRRAFLNGRLDLVQAEAVIDRIRANTDAGLRAAASAARGSLSKEIHAIGDELLEAKAHVEAAIDFVEQDLPELITDELRAHLAAAKEKMGILLATADAGCVLREGASVAIVGRPNVGKSSLFNALLRESRAIVTQTPGTTRDRLQEIVAIEGVPVRLSDTAGLRETVDDVERIGVAVTREAIAESAIVLFVVDGSSDATPEDRGVATELLEQVVPSILVVNKSDLERRLDTRALEGEFTATVEVSAKTGAGLGALTAELGGLLLRGALSDPGGAMLTRVHQKDSLRRASEAVDRVVANFDTSPELMGIELDDALKALGEITGETTPDAVLDRVFASFCIGK